VNRSKHLSGVKAQELEDPTKRPWAGILTGQKSPHRHTTNAYDLRDFSQSQTVSDGSQGQRLTDHSKTQLEADAMKSNEYNIAHRNLPCLSEDMTTAGESWAFSSGSSDRGRILGQG
jgi:hypothetical protein